MCGIIAALPSYRASLLLRPDCAEVVAGIPQVHIDDLRCVGAAAVSEVLGNLEVAIRRALRQTARGGAAAVLVNDAVALSRAVSRSETLIEELADLDEQIDECSLRWDASGTEAAQSALRKASDAAYGLRNDRLAPIQRLAAARGSSAAIEPGTAVGYLAVDRVLSAIDRLEVRGRDSAGLSIWVQLAPSDLQQLAPKLIDRHDHLLLSGSVRRFETGVAFVYKRAAVVGKLGANVAHLRASIARDPLLHVAMSQPSARVSVLAHTRWASIGRISEANAHPVDNWLSEQAPDNLAFAALNGDIDNHVALRRRYDYAEDHQISTDAKLVPLRLAEYARSMPSSTALATAIREFDGSMAIAAQVSAAPGSISLAVKGSGQALYVGVGEDGYLVASEMYGVVAAAQDYLRIDGGVQAGSRLPGTVVRLDQDSAGTWPGVVRLDGDGREIPLAASDIRSAEVTTRDLALGGSLHYLEKEIGEAASSFRKTLRGRIGVHDGRRVVELPESSLPEQLRSHVTAGRIRRITLVGQGTAAVACQGIAQVMTSLLGGRLVVRATPATEFSAYDLATDLRDTLLIAISQSGSTTDTNRTVDLAAARGAQVVAIINRRDSDLAAKAHGVIYTSDGRDVEMAVASTKAFYAQVAAGCLLGLQLGKLVETVSGDREDSMLAALEEMPAKLQQLHGEQEAIAEVARATATRYQNWAVVGSGPNRVAAAEARIKLSELCYRTVSTDAVEDKKHIDLSAESLVLVCAAGTPPGQLRDIQKEVGIFSAHRNVPVIITDTDDSEEWATPHLIRVPAAHPTLAWILSTAAAHLFSYHAALAIDAAADDLREALGVLEAGIDIGTSCRPAALQLLTATLDRVGAGELVGVLSAPTLLGLIVAVADVPAPPLGAPATFADHLLDPDEFLRAALTSAVHELTRSIDTVKHQAKTVTVGTSRDDADLYDNVIVRALLDAGADPVASLSHSVLAAINGYGALVEQISGVTRYRLRGDTTREIRVVEKSGSAAQLASRFEQWGPLIGSKELVARTRRARLLRGARDGRLVLVIPQQDGALLSGMSVVHLELRKTASGDDLLAVLATDIGRLDELRATLAETGAQFTSAQLEDLSVEDVLLAPIDAVALSIRLAG